MLEFIIRRCFAFVLAFLGSTVLLYYVEKLPIKVSVGLGLFVGILLAAGLTAIQYGSDYRLVAGTILGIMAFLLTVVFKYHVHNQPLKDSIEWGLINGCGYVILYLIFTKSIDFLFDLI